MAISRPRGVARWMALGLLAGALGGCSTVSSWFSSDTKPKPKELGANPGLLAVHQAWTAKLGAEVPLATDIHVQGDTLLIAAKDGSVTALDARNGSQLSRFTVGEPLTAGVGGDAQRQAVLTRSNQVIVYSQGKQLWKQPLPAAAYTPPLVAGGRVFAASTAGTVVALNGATGQDVWRLNLGTPIAAGVGSDGQTAAVVTQSNHLVALAVPLANQSGSGKGPAVRAAAAHIRFAAVELFAQFLQALDGLASQATKSQLLDPVSQTRFKEAPVKRRWFGLKHFSPHLLEVRCGRGFKGCNACNK